MKSIKAIARIQITVEVDADSPWGEECSIGQLYKQAADCGVIKLLNSIKLPSYRIIGQPKVISIITEEQP